MYNNDQLPCSSLFAALPGPGLPFFFFSCLYLKELNAKLTEFSFFICIPSHIEKKKHSIFLVRVILIEIIAKFNCIKVNLLQYHLSYTVPLIFQNNVHQRVSNAASQNSLIMYIKESQTQSLRISLCNCIPIIGQIKVPIISFMQRAYLELDLIVVKIHTYM